MLLWVQAEAGTRKKQVLLESLKPAFDPGLLLPCCFSQHCSWESMSFCFAQKSLTS